MTSPRKLHDDEPDIDQALVEALLADRFPDRAGLPVRHVASDGTSNMLFRLGDDLVVRMPRTPGAAADVAGEQHWMRRLGPELPVPVPTPVGEGAPGHGYPWPWAVYRWIPGTLPAVGAESQPEAFARDVAGFVRALRRVDTTGAPAADRGKPLAPRDASTRNAVARLGDVLDPKAAIALWEAALAAPGWAGPDVWVHGDLEPGNLLVDPDTGRLAAVLDFACMGVGDPAVDLIVAWYVLDDRLRDTFREAVGCDEATWTRGRGWALTIAVHELDYYRDRNAFMYETAARVVGRLLG
ncbi:aminoglycoside phosphotransferase family protein [Streptomyces sp. VRA16 Mangrove soil]|uniref:aminoglycoside phosphotransferase family protein n=1 Tax=Streptomyces sp. VRA16 Mangrove soil TaxID=2817434 RepID=UPI001AA00313|nr:aminoglycoside phosphotransferase family protein [Streptomyces sp. VRA16 Mangrove soil]MBO1332173.1 aminoglycoside phosphotransferase family protein [Streptomyces sp. VRA16 Mangrove soil]